MSRACSARVQWNRERPQCPWLNYPGWSSRLSVLVVGTRPCGRGLAWGWPGSSRASSAGVAGRISPLSAGSDVLVGIPGAAAPGSLSASWAAWVEVEAGVDASGVLSPFGLLVSRTWEVTFGGAAKWSRMSVQGRLSVVGRRWSNVN